MEEETIVEGVKDWVCSLEYKCTNEGMNLCVMVCGMENRNSNNYKCAKVKFSSVRINFGCGIFYFNAEFDCCCVTYLCLF